MIEYLGYWVTNIVLFIFLSIVSNMLIENTKMEQYSKFILRTILIATMMSPIFKLFETAGLDVKINFDPILTNEEFNNEVNYQKSEILSEQDAYILNETKVTIIEHVNNNLFNNTNYRLEDVIYRTKQEGQDLTLEYICFVVKDLNSSLTLNEAQYLEGYLSENLNLTESIVEVRECD